mmetsp:Transcript_28528/g.69437  ORF Transcript_28528/g.69437 Transcript_28528/m.69437 type:complete len:205 (-) Transcript_28528:229-843(-)
MKAAATALLFALAATALAVPTGSNLCGMCKFSVGAGCVQPYPPDVAITGPISSPNYKVAHVDQTKEAYICSDGQPIPISKYTPAGLSQPFSASFFKSYEIRTPGVCEMSGIGHETPQGNQAMYLAGLKVIVPLGAYQIADEESCNVVDNRHPTDDLTDCVMFEVCDMAEALAIDVSPSPEVSPSPSPDDLFPVEETPSPEAEMF